jgi:hypothetical protein
MLFSTIEEFRTEPSSGRPLFDNFIFDGLRLLAI